jgi:hypothetical protein
MRRGERPTGLTWGVREGRNGLRRRTCFRLLRSVRWHDCVIAGLIEELVPIRLIPLSEPPGEFLILVAKAIFPW